MKGRFQTDKTGIIYSVSEVPDNQGGRVPQKVSYGIYYVKMVKNSGTKGIESFQLGQNTSFKCETIAREFMPKPNDILTIDGVDYAISDPYFDDTNRVKILKFTATQRT